MIIIASLAQDIPLCILVILAHMSTDCNLDWLSYFLWEDQDNYCGKTVTTKLLIYCQGKYQPAEI